MGDNSNDDGCVMNANIEAFRQVVREPSNLPDGLDFQYEIRVDHRTVTSVWNEWFGEGDFEPLLNNGMNYYRGGISALEKKYHNTWRPTYNGSQNKHLSRCKNIVKCLSLICEKTLQEKDLVLRYVDSKLYELNVSKITPMLKYLQQNKEEIIISLLQ